jgi:hypothetical protein
MAGGLTARAFPSFSGTKAQIVELSLYDPHGSKNGGDYANSSVAVRRSDRCSHSLDANARHLKEAAQRVIVEESAKWCPTISKSPPVGGFSFGEANQTGAKVENSGRIRATSFDISEIVLSIHRRNPRVLLQTLSSKGGNDGYDRTRAVRRYRLSAATKSMERLFMALTIARLAASSGS